MTIRSGIPIASTCKQVPSLHNRQSAIRATKHTMWLMSHRKWGTPRTAAAVQRVKTKASWRCTYKNEKERRHLWPHIHDHHPSQCEGMKEESNEKKARHGPDGENLAGQPGALQHHPPWIPFAVMSSSTSATCCKGRLFNCWPFFNRPQAKTFKSNISQPMCVILCQKTIHSRKESSNVLVDSQLSWTFSQNQKEIHCRTTMKQKKKKCARNRHKWKKLSVQLPGDVEQSCQFLAAYCATFAETSTLAADARKYMA